MAQFNMGIGLETGGVAAGAKRATNALDDISDSLDDLGKDGEKGGEKVERALRDAQKEAKDTSRSFKNMAQDAEGSFRDVGDSGSRGVGRAGESVQGFKEESIQNFSEVASSFDGSMQGAADGVQGLFGGLASSLPVPLGIAAGTIGLIFGAALQGMADQSEAVKQKVADLTGEWIEAGKAGKTGSDFIADALKTMATETDDTSKSLGELRRNYQRSGQTGVSSFDDLAQAIVGAGGNLDDILKKQQKYLDKLNAQAAQTDRSVGSDKQAAAAIDQKVQAQQKLVDGLNQSKTAADEATDAQKAYAESGAAELQAKSDAIDNINGALEDGADNWQDYTDEAGNFDPNKYIDGYNKLAETIANAATSIEQSNLPEQAKAYLQGLPPEQQAAYINSYKKAAPGTQSQLGAIWQAMGKASGATYVSNLTGSIPKTVQGPTVVIGADDSKFQRTIRKLQDGYYQATVTVDGKTSYGQKYK